MKKGNRNIGNRITWIGVLLVLGLVSCSKKASVSVKQLEPTAHAMQAGVQEVQISTRSMYCNQIRSMRKQQDKSNP
jgi:hypothetical protein